MRSLDQILTVPGAVFVMLLVAAFLEVSGDAFFQSAVHRTSGFSRYMSVVGGVLALSLYGLLLNLPRWNFGRLLGIYVVLFFLIAQVIAKLRFHEPISWPQVVGGVLIASGGLVMTLWRS